MSGFSELAVWELPFLDGEYGGVAVGEALGEGGAQVLDRYVLLIGALDRGYTADEARQLGKALLQAADVLEAADRLDSADGDK